MALQNFFTAALGFLQQFQLVTRKRRPPSSSGFLSVQKVGSLSVAYSPVRNEQLPCPNVWRFNQSLFLDKSPMPFEEGVESRCGAVV
jgi:hypothetical protein